MVEYRGKCHMHECRGQCVLVGVLPPGLSEAPTNLTNRPEAKMYT